VFWADSEKSVTTVTMTFFQGSLQEGIAAALQQAKSVVCFVTGERVLRGISLMHHLLTK
jgi:hypothetical protein